MKISFSHGGSDFQLLFSREDDHIARIVASTHNFYEIELLDYLRLTGIQGETAIDVGANIGNHSLYFARFLAEQVICVEPNKEALPLLYANMAATQGACTFVEKALASTPGFATIVPGTPENLGTAKIAGTSGDIEVTTLDSIAPSAGVFLVKIDVEGMEIEVLAGANRLLSTQRPHLVVEAGTDQAYKTTKSYLSNYGYVPLTRWGATPTYHFAFNPNLYQFIKAKLVMAYLKLVRLVA